MSQYVDWEYYSSLYNDVSVDEFPRLALRASNQMDLKTHSRVGTFIGAYSADSATAHQKMVYDAIKNTTCEVINLLQAQDSSAVGTGVASVSNDGYSESYKVTTQAEKSAELTSCIRNGLSGTGLCGAL